MKKSDSYNKRLEDLREYLKKVEYLKYTLNSLVYWDKITQMPEKGIGYRSEVMAFLGEELYKLFSSDELHSYMDYFENNENNSNIVNSMVRRIKRNYIYVNKIPKDEYREYIILIANAEQAWDRAKKESDFSIFSPYLEKIVKHFRNFAEYWGYEDDPYDALIGYYEEGVTVKKINNMIAELRDFIIGLLSKIEKGENEIKEDYFYGEFSFDKQRDISEDILKIIGFDFKAGRLDVSTHPTTLASSPDDVRVVTSFSRNDIRSGIFNALHEGGKGLYEQDISKDLLGLLLAEVASMGLEEAEARFYENIVGRSKGFWEFYYPRLKKYIPSFKNVTAEEFYKGINKCKPTLIRIDADELTYVLHIIIRYEIEQELISGKTEVKNLPEVWNSKYQEYLGITPDTDADGVLQDIHWAAGYFGFFPSYVLSNLYAAQFLNAMNKQIGDIDEKLRNGEFESIHTWLKQNVHQHGAVYTPGELVLKVSGEKLKPDYYINYLRKKYSEVYNITIDEGEK